MAGSSASPRCCQPFSSISRRTKIIIIAVAMVATLGLALGLGLGLTVGQARCAPASSCSNGKTSSSPPSDSNSSAVWQPAAGTTWQIVLQSALDMSSVSSTIAPNAATVFDIDLFDNTNNGDDSDQSAFTATIDKLHSLDKKVICYFSAGTYEPYRPDASDYDASSLGAALPDWPDEKWVDIRTQNVRDIVKARIELAASAGCDAVDPDNVDVYQNQNGGGFSTPITRQDSVEFVNMMATHASSLGLATGLKNALNIIPDVADALQFAVNEECASYSECGGALKKHFVDSGKPVFHIEYPGDGVDKSQGYAEAKREKYCAASKGVPADFSTVLKTYDLDGWVQYCDGGLFTTPMEQ